MKKASRVFLNTYAAYGGIYSAASLIWLWAAEGQRPTFTDSTGAAITERS